MLKNHRVLPVLNADTADLIAGTYNLADLWTGIWELASNPMVLKLV